MVSDLTERHTLGVGGELCAEILGVTKGRVMLLGFVGLNVDCV